MIQTIQTKTYLSNSYAPVYPCIPCPIMFPTFQKRQHRNLADTEFRTLHKYRTPPSTHPPTQPLLCVSKLCRSLLPQSPFASLFPFAPTEQSQNLPAKQPRHPPHQHAPTVSPTLHPEQPVPPYRSNPKPHSHTRVYLTTIYVSPPTRSTILIQSIQASTWTVKSPVLLLGNRSKFQKWTYSYPALTLDGVFVFVGMLIYPAFGMDS